MNPTAGSQCLSLSESERSLGIHSQVDVGTSACARINLGRLSLVVCDRIIMAFRVLFHATLALASIILGMYACSCRSSNFLVCICHRSHRVSLLGTDLEFGLPFTQAPVLLHVSFPAWINDPCFRSSTSTLAEAARI